MEMKKRENKASVKWWKRWMAGLLSMIMVLTGVDITALAYQADKTDYLTIVDKDGNEIVKEEESWEEEFPNGTFAFKNEYINLQESPEPETQKITIYRLGGTAGEATAKIAVSSVVSYLDEEGKEAVYANAASSQDYTLEAEDSIGISENGEITYSPVELNQEDIYGTSFFDITFAEGEWVKDVLVTPLDDDEHESQELALLTIYEAEGAVFTETANRATISIADDEEVLPSEMGFDTESIRVDKSEQKAVIKVKRTGALQYVSSVEYRTEDGTARAGEDYVKAEGTASFSGDIDYFDIQVDLIDNKEISEEDKSFTIVLSDPKGGTVKAGSESIQVDLFNSNTSQEDNLATRLQSPDAADLTAQVKTEEKAIAENDNQVVTAPDAQVEEVIEADYRPVNEKGRSARSVVTDGKEISFGNNQGKWKDTHTNPEQIGIWSGSQDFSKFDGGAELSTYYDAYMALNIPGIFNRFTTLDWKVECATRKGLYAFLNYLSATYGALGTKDFCYLDTGNMEGTGDDQMDIHLNEQFKKDNFNVYGSDWLFQFRGKQADKSATTGGTIKIGSPKYDHLVFKIRGTKHKGTQRDRYGKIKLYDFAIHRRALAKNPVVTVITPDEDDKLASRLDEVKPVFSLESDASGINASGTNGSGKLYYGSRIKVTENTKANQYKLAKAELTTQWGETLWNGNIESSPNSPSYTFLEIAKQGNTNERLTEDNLQIKTYLERVQKFNISYKASMLEDDTDEVKNQKKAKISSNITYKAKAFDANSCSYNDISGKLNLADMPNDSRYETGNLKNVKSVNFNLNDGSLILYNNVAYAGNTDIPISPEHYNAASVTFSVYTPDAISVERDPEILSINKIRLYVDENEDGTYTQGEALLKDIPDREFCMDELQPVGGHPLVMKVDYTYMPACIVVPPGGDGKETFSLMPSFVTTLTEESVKEKLTEEMQGYRDILCKDGTAPLYAVSNGTLSVPLGQDASPAQFNENKKAYEWKPQWKGNLAKNYAAPGKIYLDNTFMPNGFLAASTKEEINQYLGCLQGNDTLVVSSRMDNKVTAIQTAGFTTYPEMGAQSFDQGAMPEVNAPQDDQGVTDNLPDAADTSPSLELPNMELGIGPLSYIMGKDEIGFSVGVPLIEKKLGATKEENQESLNQAKKAFNDKNVFQKLRERARKNGAENPGFNGGDMKGKTDVASFEMAANATFMWKYNKKTANYEFSSAMVAVAVSGSVKLQYRFSVCPIFYVYLSMGGEMNMKTGLNVEVDIDENGNKKNDVSFAGLTIAPSVFIEAGMGVGIDIAKLEVYVHVSVSMAMTYKDEFSFDRFETGAAVGFNAVFLFFSYKMDLIGCTAGYDRDKEDNGSNGWYFKWTLCGKEMKGRRARSAEMPEIPGANVEVELPKDTSGTQKFYTSDDNVIPEIMPMAFDLDGMPFQTSGYGSSAAAVKLADGLNAAAGYELLTVGDKNYLIYTISREHNETGRSTDSTQIVLSELTTTSKNGDEVKGLANPVDPASERPYIVVDQTAGSDESLGDLEFGASVKNGKITVTWTSYKENAYDNVKSTWEEEEVLAEISRHVCVKKASFTPGTDAGFTDAQVVSEDKENAGYRFLPKAVNDDVLFFGEAQPYSQEELEKKKEEYKAYYETAADGNEADGSGGTGDPYANANYKYSITLDSLYGQYSKLNFAVRQKDKNIYKNVTIEPSQTWKEQGARIDYVRFMEDTEDSFYLAYATSQEDIKDGDKQTVKKLYLQKMSVKEGAVQETPEAGGTETTLVPGKPVLIKTLVDSEKDDSLDGEYQGGQLVKQFAAPAFNNLKFLNGKLTAEGGKETFFLFGMNGMTYVIDKASLDLFCEEKAGTVTPFFKAEENGNSQADTVIGADGDGNISAVYTDTVPNTVNNALYLTKYDPSVKAFGEGIMLAMNHMQVYEDAQAGSWGAEETKEAYFDVSKSGGMDKFSFAQPQIALGTPTTEETQGTLSIVTQGTYTNLVRTTLQKPGTGELVEEVIPDMENGISGQMGVYALTYGVGRQQIGEEAIQLNMEEFVPGAKLDASVSFRNTGDVAIRGADDDRYAGSIKLLAAKRDGSDARELASWKILSNVLAGQQVTTDTVQTSELPEDIADRVLYFEVSENTDYITDGAFFTSTFQNPDGLGKIVVGNRAEVRISEISVSAGQDMKRENVNGKDSLIVDLDMVLENKGIRDAENIRIQLERSDGKTESGENNYIPLELGQTLVRYEGQDLTEAGKNGVYKVTGGVETGQGGKETVKSVAVIPAGNSVRLKGKITLPVECFDLTSPKESMNLRFTALTDTREYTKQNNASYVSFDPVTKFYVPSALNLTLGNTVNFDMAYITGAAKNSNISATEMVLSSAGEAQEAAADEKLLDVLNYNPVNGMLSVRAGKTGSGIVRIADTATNSYVDMVFANTAEGTNITLTNQALTFKNSAQGSWEDKNIGRITADAVLPYNHDICVGKKGGTFTFTTYASSMELYFSGKAEVSSKNAFGFGSVIVEGSGKSAAGEYFEPAVIDFKNNGLQKHEVTVTVLGDQAEFDKMIEKYGTEGDIGDIVEKDTAAPKIVLGKAAPGTGKLQSGTTFEMPVYIYDNMAVNSVSIDGGGADTYIHQGFAQATLSITENRTYRIIAVDSYGNRASQDILVDWFDTGITGEPAKDTWPEISAEAVDEGHEPINGFTSGAAYIRYQVSAPQGVQRIKVYAYDPDTDSSVLMGNEIRPEEAPKEIAGVLDVAIPENGYYRIEAEDSLRQVTNRIFYLNCLSKGPEVNLYKSTNQAGKLFYSVGSQTNEVNVEQMAIYRGKVQQTSSDSIIVEGESPVLSKDYRGKAVTWDTGTIDLSGSSIYTIMAKDVSGRIRTFIYNDNFSLSGLAVHSEGYDLEMEAFSPYKYEYHVLLPYGYPEKQLPSVEHSISAEAAAAGAKVTKKEEEDKVTVTLSYGGVDTDYTIYFEREVCTCGIDLVAYDDQIIIPYGQDTLTKKLDTRIEVSPCSVKGHNCSEEDVKYKFEVTEGKNYLEVSGDGTATYRNFPKGSTGVKAKVKVTAYTDTASAEADITCSINREYRLHLETTHCGHIETKEESEEAGGGTEGTPLTVLPDEQGRKAIDFELTSGENYQFTAVVDQGCVFEGWADETGEIIKTENTISGVLTENMTLKAVFKDITPPVAAIGLKAIEKPEEGEGKDEILYSKEGIEITLTGEDHESGVRSIRYQIVEAGETYDKESGWKDYTEPVTLTEDIFGVVYARVEDEEGNVTIVNSKEILIDKEGGKLILTPNFTSGEWTRKEDAQIHVLATEGTSPLKRITYIVDGKAHLRTYNQFMIKDLADGDYEVKVIAEDEAGHILTDTVQVKKETVETTIKVTGNPTELVREATLTADVTTGVSGLKEITVNGKKIEGNTYKLKESENGTYVFAATSNGGSTATVTVEVTNMIIKVEGIQPTETKISLATGKTHQIKWKVLPEDATYQQVSFQSRDEEKARVDENGLITALKEGETAITITSVDNPSVHTEIVLDLFEEYKLHASVDTGGKVEYNGKTLVTSEKGGQAEKDVYLRKGTEYTLEAIPLKGYEFIGWKNEQGELVQKESVISSRIIRDVTLHADFRDNVAPNGAIHLKELDNPEQVEMQAKLTENPENTCAYSSRGFQVTIESSDVPSGVKSVEYQVLAAEQVLDETKGWQEYREPFTLEEDSDVIVYARIADHDGNVTLIHSDEIVIDHKGVSIQVEPNFVPGEWNNSKANQIGVKVQENVTKIKKITWMMGEEAHETEERTFVIDKLKDGDYEIKVVTEDAAGNLVEAVIPLKQDTAVPSVKVTGNPTQLARSAVLEIQAEPGISGLKEIRVNGTAIEGNSYTAQENGTYEISVTNRAGTTATEKIEVTKVIVEVEAIQADDQHEMVLGDTWQANWKIMPENADFPQVSFAVSDERVATVSENGKVTAKKSGKTVLTILSSDNQTVKKEVTLYVKLPKIKAKAESDQQILLTWKSAAGVKEYWIYRALQKNGKYRRIGKARESAYRDKKAKKGRTYYYKVLAVGQEKRYNGELGEAVKAKACLKTPENVKVILSGRNYKVKWSKSEGAKAYTVYRSAKANGGYKRIGTTSRTSFTDVGSGRKKQWYYRVKALGSKARWNSATSKSVAFKKKKPLKKTSITLKKTPGIVELSWKKVSGATNYQIYRAGSLWGVYTKAAETGKVTEWRDETVEKGRTYYYKIRAISRSGKSIKRTGSMSKAAIVKAD